MGLVMVKSDGESQVVGEQMEKLVAEKSMGYFPVNGVFSVYKIGVSPPERMSTASVIDSLFSGEDLSAIMVLPVRKDVVVTSPKQG